MAAIELKTERPVLTVSIDGEREVGVPLTFTRAELEVLGKAKDQTAGMLNFLKSYLGDVVDRIGDDDLTTLVKAWTDERRKIGEPELGEPSASPGQ